MRRVTRLPLDPPVQADLDSRQAAVSQRLSDAAFSPADEWKSARRTPTLTSVLSSLRHMMGERERCVYCLDSHGTDIEHFWPKTPYPERMFDWLNLLLCCAECGRFKLDRFPLGANGVPLLVDPTVEDPWAHFDFDPGTGNIVPRFDQNTNGFSSKGQETVNILKLDRREAMANGYKRTLRRIKGVVDAALNLANPVADALIAKLREADDHGLLAWCFKGSGQNDYPFSELREKHPTAWAACVAEFD